eukprot:TRINITY_DN6904_c0_g1_i6.p1 TRINITY_DN6904_c0_g1~~TRINITY_DN6904_c0_g1_i6.p1  ORF type:complete len:400 (+),score=114.46 TRINITY_DN6904_c0_g1_i6:73-1200(+)
MPRVRHSEVQRLRSQLAVSRDEVRALEQKVAQLSVASVSAAQERAAAEQLLLERLAIADARCQEAVRRGEAAEVKVLEHVEAEQRAGLMHGALDKLRGMFPEAAETSSRAELVVAEAAAWETLAIVHAAHRKEVKRLRKNQRKKRQKDRKRELERHNRGKPTPQDDGGAISDTPGEFTVARSFVSSTDSDVGSVTPSSASEALFVDNICFWVAAFVPRSWAPVCSKASRTVFRVINIYLQGLDYVGVRLAHMQSKGRDYAPDHGLWGPGLGTVYRAYVKVQALKEKVMRDREYPGCGDQQFITRWLLHMDFQLSMYDSLRLRTRELYLAVRHKYIVYENVLDNIKEALDAFDNRKIAEANEEEDGGATAELSSSA